MSDETKPADAVMIPAAMAGGGDLRAKVGRLSLIARPLMGLGDKDAPPQISHAGPEFFARRTIHDTILFPKDHERAGEHRYEWTDRGGGVKVGRLVDGA